MNADQLELIADKADRYADYVVDGCDGVLVACRDARAEVAAMRTPITPESLEADGWKLKGWRWWRYGGETFSMYWEPDDKRWEFAIGRIGMITVASPSNMFDIGELMRLLGGER